MYGGTSGTGPEQTYYKAFLEKYSRVAQWHTELQNAAIKDKLITLPTGRQYAFPYAKRLMGGGSSSATQIKNYPVQGFATGDIVPLAAIRFVKLLIKHEAKSLLINEVHDSLVVDVYPGEQDLVMRLLTEAMVDIVDEIEQRYGYTMRMPLTIEIKIGPNELDSVKVM